MEKTNPVAADELIKGDRYTFRITAKQKQRLNKMDRLSRRTIAQSLRTYLDVLLDKQSTTEIVIKQKSP